MKAAKPGEPLDAPPEVWAEINETLDREAEGYKAALREALARVPPEDDDKEPAP